MRTSEKGFKFIAENEGIRLKAYLDSGGIPTIGIGHKILPNENFGRGITTKQAYDLLQKDVAAVEVYLNTYFQPEVLTQNKYDVLVDFGFNLGVGALHQLLKHGVANVPTEIVKWIHVNGKVVPGLVTRRQKELELWNS